MGVVFKVLCETFWWGGGGVFEVLCEFFWGGGSEIKRPAG